MAYYRASPIVCGAVALSSLKGFAFPVGRNQRSANCANRVVCLACEAGCLHSVLCVTTFRQRGAIGAALIDALQKTIFIPWRRPIIGRLQPSENYSGNGSPAKLLPVIPAHLCDARCSSISVRDTILPARYQCQTLWRCWPQSDSWIIS